MHKVIPTWVWDRTRWKSLPALLIAAKSAFPLIYANANASAKKLKQLRLSKERSVTKRYSLVFQALIFFGFNYTLKTIYIYFLIGISQVSIHNQFNSDWERFLYIFFLAIMKTTTFHGPPLLYSFLVVW